MEQKSRRRQAKSKEKINPEQVADKIKKIARIFEKHLRQQGKQ